MLVTFGKSNFASLFYYFHDYMTFCFSLLSFSTQNTGHEFNVSKFQNYLQEGSLFLLEHASYQSSHLILDRTCRNLEDSVEW